MDETLSYLVERMFRLLDEKQLMNRRIVMAQYFTQFEGVSLLQSQLHDLRRFILLGVVVTNVTSSAE